MPNGDSTLHTPPTLPPLSKLLSFQCYGAIHWAKIPTCYYAATAEDAAKAGFDDQFIYDAIKGVAKEVLLPAFTFSVGLILHLSKCDGMAFMSRTLTLTPI